MDDDIDGTAEHAEQVLRHIALPAQHVLRLGAQQPGRAVQLLFEEGR